MDAETRLKEMEEEIKVLKAEIRNVLLDIREVILERTNPLDGPEPALIRMDLRTTASAMAAEAASHEARNAMDAAEAAAHHNGDSPEHEPGVVPPHTHDEPEAEESLDVESPEVDEPVDEPPPRVIRRDPRELKMLAEERDAQNDIQIPPAYRADTPPASYRVDLAPLSGNGSLAAWLAQALSVVTPHELSRIIAVHRSWGNLPPNLSRALAYVQEMLEQSEDADPAWLRVMKQLDALASL